MRFNTTQLLFLCILQQATDPTLKSTRSRMLYVMKQKLIRRYGKRIDEMNQCCKAWNTISGFQLVDKARLYANLIR